MSEPPTTPAPPRPERRIFTNRTLNMRALKAIGYDMDYTLVHYRVEHWERRAYEHLKERLSALGWPVAGLEYEPDMLTRGLIVDTELGNIVKANRFGYVNKACHGTAMLPFEILRTTYGRTLVDLADRRYEFLNTFFSLSEACMYAQLVEILDRGELPATLGYEELFRTVSRALDAAHLEGQLKAQIIADPETYVEPDPDLAMTLMDQRDSGKKLLLITNSEWLYTREMMSFAFAGLPSGTSWRDLFDVVIVAARKPEFFSLRMPLFEVVTEDGLLRPCPGGLRKPGCYVGGDASQVEAFLEVDGEEILYVGDHIFADVHVSKDLMRWRTALLVRELEDELAALTDFSAAQQQLAGLMEEKVRMEYALSHLRLALQRSEAGRPPGAGATQADELRESIGELRGRLIALDERVAPLARRSGELLNSRWGLLMRAGIDKSHLAQQVERYADVYTSRVSNFLFETPFAYLRAPRSSLAHDL